MDDATLVELAVLLEDAIDIHDRHWKIHWMLNFAQFSATMALNATIQEVKGDVDAGLVGRLQSSVDDRNWDSIEALWKMKEEVKGEPELQAAFHAGDTAAAVLRALEASELGSQVRRGAAASRTSRSSAPRRSGRTSSSIRRGARTRPPSSRPSAAIWRRTTTTRAPSPPSRPTSKGRSTSCSTASTREKDGTGCGLRSTCPCA